MVRVLKLCVHLVQNYFKIDSSRSFRIVGLIFETVPLPLEEKLSLKIKVFAISKGNNKNIERSFTLKKRGHRRIERYITRYTECDIRSRSRSIEDRRKPNQSG